MDGLRRRQMIGTAAAIPLLAAARGAGAAGSPAEGGGWPSPAEWGDLGRLVSGNLSAIRSPFEACQTHPDGAECAALFRNLKNPYFIRDDPALTQTLGWVGAWWTQPSRYALAPQSSAHVAAAVNFARTHKVRLVIRGGGHSYLGTSNAPDSLMIWTRPMNGIALHDAFVPMGCEKQMAPAPAVTVGAGAIWGEAYQRVTTEAGRYVQGGGCLTVGVAGLVQGGGFGTYSKRFGLAGASLLEAEIVTADGAVRVVNACREPDLFWALKGGGGGTFGVVTRLTLRTWDLPEVFGHIALDVQARSDAAYRRLIGAFVGFYADALCTPHWGELARVGPDNRLRIAMNSQGLDEAAMRALWQPFLAVVAADAEVAGDPPMIVAGPGRMRWDGAALARFAPNAVVFDDRPGSAVTDFFWAANRAEAGHVIYGYESIWLPARLLDPDQRAGLADALMAASRHRPVEMHFQKGLAGGASEAIAAARETPMNPAVAEAFMLAIIGSEGPPAYPGIAGHEPNSEQARRDGVQVGRAIADLRKIAPGAGAYVAESSWFQPDWQRAYWGSNYERLLAVKRRYDPEGLFSVRHSVGSEA